MFKNLNITLALFAVTILFGCGGFIKGKGAAVANFHAFYNGGKLDDIWKTADPKFRAAMTKQKYDDFLGAMERKLGKVSMTSNSAWKVNSVNLQTTVSMTQQTTFEHGQGIESFTFAMSGTNAVLLSYNIQSMDLITK